MNTIWTRKAREACPVCTCKRIPVSEQIRFISTLVIYQWLSILRFGNSSPLLQSTGSSLSSCLWREWLDTLLSKSRSRKIKSQGCLIRCWLGLKLKKKFRAEKTCWLEELRAQLRAYLGCTAGDVVRRCVVVFKKKLKIIESSFLRQVDGKPWEQRWWRSSVWPRRRGRPTSRSTSCLKRRWAGHPMMTLNFSKGDHN